MFPGVKREKKKKTLIFNNTNFKIIMIQMEEIILYWRLLYAILGDILVWITSFNPIEFMKMDPHTVLQSGTLNQENMK